MVKIVGIVGSLRPDAYSALALQQAMERVKELGAVTDTLDLREMDLPFCDGNIKRKS
jgi:FMN reductase